MHNKWFMMRTLFILFLIVVLLLQCLFVFFNLWKISSLLVVFFFWVCVWNKWNSTQGTTVLIGSFLTSFFLAVAIRCILTQLITQNAPHRPLSADAGGGWSSKSRRPNCMSRIEGRVCPVALCFHDLLKVALEACIWGGNLVELLVSGNVFCFFPSV